MSSPPPYGPPPPGQGRYGPPSGQPGYGPAAGYGPPAYGQQPGHGAGFAPPASRNRLYLILGAVGAVVLIVFLLIFFAFGAGSTSTPDRAAEAYVAAVNAKDTGAAQKLTCAAQQHTSATALDFASGLPKPLKDMLKDVKVQMTLKGVNQTGDTTAEAMVDLSVTGLPGGLASLSSTNSLALDFAREDGGWRFCGGHLGG